MTEKAKKYSPYTAEPQVRIVQVLWLDANCIDRLDADALEDMKRDGEPLLAPYWSVGYLIEERKDCILISQAVLPKMTGDDCVSYRRVLVIPRCQIKGYWELKKA